MGVAPQGCTHEWCKPRRDSGHSPPDCYLRRRAAGRRMLPNRAQGIRRDRWKGLNLLFAGLNLGTKRFELFLRPLQARTPALLAFLGRRIDDKVGAGLG